MCPSPDLSPPWRRLASIRSFVTEVFSGDGSQTGWSGHSRGSVEVRSVASPAQLDFLESGQHVTAQGKTLTTRNHWQWTRLEGILQLAHSRQGHPVHLAALHPQDPYGHTFASAAPHLCGPDRYTLRLHIDGTSVLLEWRITGPQKNEQLRTTYSPAAPDRRFRLKTG